LSPAADPATPRQKSPSWARALNARAPLLLGALLAAVALLRIGTADYSLWYDELASLEFARQPLARLWSDWMLRETNPPLFYTLLAGAIAWLGHGDVAVRLLPIAIGLAGIGAAYLLGRALGSARVGLLAAALLSLSAEHSDLSHQVRSYSLAHTAVLFACLGMVGYLDRRSRAALILYAAATLVALYAHTTLALFAGLAALTMLWLLRGDRRAQLHVILANAGVLALWGWWATISLRQIAMPVTNIDWISAPSLAEAVDMTAVAYLPMYLHAPGPISTALLVALFAGLRAWAARVRRPDVTLLAVLAAGAPLLLFAISQRVPIFLPRTLSWASGPALVLLSLAICQIRSPLVRVAATATVLLSSAIGLATWLPSRERDHWRDAVAAIERLPALPVIVGDDAVALALQKYRSSPPLLTPIVVQSRWRERWPAGLYPGPHLSPEAARQQVRARGCALVVSWGPMVPPVLNGATTRRVLPHSRSPEVLLVSLSGPGRCPS
jgi:hypothetical protein